MLNKTRKLLINVLAALVFGVLLLSPVVAQSQWTPVTPEPDVPAPVEVGVEAPTPAIALNPDAWEVIQYLTTAAIFCFVAWLLHRSIPPEQRDRLYSNAEIELKKAEDKAKLTPSFIDDLAVELARRGLVIVKQQTEVEKSAPAEN